MSQKSAASPRKEARRTLAPGQKGTKRMTDKYGSQLLYVRYRYDQEQGRRCTTVELIEEESVWHPRRRLPVAHKIVRVRVSVAETQLQRAIRAAGGKWNRARRVWELRYYQAIPLGLEERIEEAEVSNTRHPKSV